MLFFLWKCENRKTVYFSCQVAKGAGQLDGSRRGPRQVHLQRRPEWSARADAETRRWNTARITLSAKHKLKWYVIHAAIKSGLMQFKRILLDHFVSNFQESLCEISQWFREEQQKSIQSDSGKDDGADRTESGGKFSVWSLLYKKYWPSFNFRLIFHQGNLPIARAAHHETLGRLFMWNRRTVRANDVTLAT